MLSTKYLIDTTSLSSTDISLILDTAETFADINKRPIKKIPTLKGRTIVNLFLEPSTRTKASFELAGKRLSADVINMSGSSSSVKKGESFKDTIETLDAMDTDMFIVRSKFAGSPRMIADITHKPVINGGDGKHQHPTQALLDLFTMRSHFGHLDGLNVAIVGDILHSRVAGSLVPALKTMGAQVTLVAPVTYLPMRPDIYDVEIAESFDDVVSKVDIVYLLRIQRERSEGVFVPSLREYSNEFCLTKARAQKMKDSAIVMHPGPMNRGVEIQAEVADSDIALVLNQVNAGVAVRMACMYLLLGGSKDA